MRGPWITVGALANSLRNNLGLLPTLKSAFFMSYLSLLEGPRPGSGHHWVNDLPQEKAKLCISHAWAEFQSINIEEKRIF